MIKKNDEVVVKIESIGAEGEGIGRIDGYALFVKDAVVGDLVRVKIMKAKKHYAYARLMELIEPSKHRVEPKCPIAKQCGGCQVQQISYEKQLEYKQDKVKNCLTRIGKFDVWDESVGQITVEQNAIIMEPIIGMDNPFHYRNKAQFPVGVDKDGNLVTGFYASRTHSIVHTEHCYIQNSVNDLILDIVLEFMREFEIEAYNEEYHRGLVRHILTRVGYVTKEVMVCLIVNGSKLPNSDILVERLQSVEGITSICLNINQEKTNVILGDQVRCLWGQPYITDYIGEVKYRISPLSFYQVNPIQTKRLYEQALEYASLDKDEIVWDLYCGIGTISLFLAKAAKEVYGVEIVPQAIEDARVNAKINGIENAAFYVGAAEDVMPKLFAKEHMKADVIVVDPPRKGCEISLLDTVIGMEPKRVVYVSCDPATLARDLRYLSDRGYQVKRVRPVDMFPHSMHVETVVLMSRVDK